MDPILHAQDALLLQTYEHFKYQGATVWTEGRVFFCTLSRFYKFDTVRSTINLNVRSRAQQTTTLPWTRVSCQHAKKGVHIFKKNKKQSEALRSCVCSHRQSRRFVDKTAHKEQIKLDFFFFLWHLYVFCCFFFLGKAEVLFENLYTAFEGTTLIDLGICRNMVY